MAYKFVYKGKYMDPYQSTLSKLGQSYNISKSCVRQEIFLYLASLGASCLEMFQKLSLMV